MIEEFKRLKEKDQALLCISALYEGNKALSLLESLSSSQLEQLLPPLEKFLKKTPEKQKEEINSGISLVKGEGTESLFYHADPAWVSEIFKGESPQVLALILQAFPKNKIGGVLKDLSKEMRRALKKTKVSGLSEEIRQLVQRESEATFPSIRIEILEGEEIFRKLSNLSLKQLMDLLREMGIEEMAMAFSRINRSAIRAILNRLNIQDAKELLQRIKKGTQCSYQEQREAQLHILSLDFEKLNPQEIIQEIGFGVLSRVFGKDDDEAATFFVYKLPPRQGYLLKRLIGLNASQNTGERITMVRNRFINAYKRMVEEGLE